MGLIGLIIVGAAAGFIATRLMGMNADLITTVAIGILGALIGGLLIRMVWTVSGWLGGFVGAVLGAMLLIWLYRKYFVR